MRAQLFWIGGPPGMRLAILARPRGGDWLTDESRSWREQGVDVVVSLLTFRRDRRSSDLAEEAGACTAAGTELIAVPVPDRGVPESRADFADAVAKLSEVSSAGKTIGIHCRAGIGRSAMLAASLLITAGFSPGDAFERIRAARGSPVPDTPEQRAWVERFAENYPVKAG